MWKADRTARLRELLARPGDAPPGHLIPPVLAWLDWSGSALDLAAPPGREAAAAFLRALRETQPTRTADACYGHFQTAAARIWGAAETAHLAAALRDVRVAGKAAPQDPHRRAELAVERLPHAAWREAFAPLLAPTAPRGRRRMRRREWSAAYLESVCRALAAWARWQAAGADAVPSCTGLEAYAQALAARGTAAISIASYLERIAVAFREVLAPGQDLDRLDLVIARWGDRAAGEEGRKGKAARIVPASRIHALGHTLMAEARGAPVRGLAQARIFRDGILLAVATALPERARALAALSFGTTLELDPPAGIRVALPGTVLKLRAHRKARGGYETVFHNRPLHDALAEYRTAFRPLFDSGDWLFPSTRDRAHPVTEAQLGRIARNVTRRRLGVAVNVHLLRDCVATELIESVPGGGTLAAPVLRHRDRRVTARHYDHATTVAEAQELAEVTARLGGVRRQDPDL